MKTTPMKHHRRTRLAPPSVEGLLGSIRVLIQEAREKALRAVDAVQVRACWEIGRHIIEFEQGGMKRAEYGSGLLDRLAARLTAEFGKGFDASNLYKMSQFYRLFQNLDALRLELSWTHYRLLLRVEDPAAREWYMNEEPRGTGYLSSSTRQDALRNTPNIRDCEDESWNP